VAGAFAGLRRWHHSRDESHYGFEGWVTQSGEDAASDGIRADVGDPRRVGSRKGKKATSRWAHRAVTLIYYV